MVWWGVGFVPPPDVFNIEPWRWGHKGGCDTCSTVTPFPLLNQNLANLSIKKRTQLGVSGSIKRIIKTTQVCSLCDALNRLYRSHSKVIERRTCRNFVATEVTGDVTGCSQLRSNLGEIRVNQC